MSVTGPDLSHYQGAPNFAAIKTAGHSFVVLKATQGVGYTDPVFVANRKAAHAAGLIVGIYHFAAAGVPVNEAAYFTGTIGALQPGEFLVLDWEITYAGDHVAWCKAWLDAVTKTSGVRPLIYMNQSTCASHNWSLVAPLYGLWLAKYDLAPAVQTPVPYWGVPAMKQYTDKGAVPGVAGTCDVNVFFGSAAQLLAYCTPTGADMPLTDADLMAVENHAYIAVRNLLADMAGGNAATSVSALGTVLSATPLGTQVGDLHGKVVDSVFDLTGRPGPDRDDLLGQVLSLRAELRAVKAPTVDAKALAAALVADTAAVSTLADALAAAIAHRLGNG